MNRLPKVGFACGFLMAKPEPCKLSQSTSELPQHRSALRIFHDRHITLIDDGLIVIHLR